MIKIYEQSGASLDALVCLALGKKLVDGKSQVAYTSNWEGLGKLINDHPSCVPQYDGRFNCWFTNKQPPATFGIQTFVLSFFRAFVVQRFGVEFEMSSTTANAGVVHELNEQGRTTLLCLLAKE